MSKSSDKRFEKFSKLIDDLLGPVEEWPQREVDQYLADAGVDMDSATRTLYERVSEIAGTYRGRNENVPGPVSELLQQMRPVDLPTSDPEASKRAARNWIANLRRPKPQISAPQIAYAFRNKKERLTAKDRAVLEDLEARLKGRTRSDS